MIDTHQGSSSHRRTGHPTQSGVRLAAHGESQAVFFVARSNCKAEEGGNEGTPAMSELREIWPSLRRSTPINDRIRKRRVDQSKLSAVTTCPHWLATIININNFRLGPWCRPRFRLSVSYYHSSYYCLCFPLGQRLSKTITRPHHAPGAQYGYFHRYYGVSQGGSDDGVRDSIA